MSLKRNFGSMFVAISLLLSGCTAPSISEKSTPDASTEQQGGEKRQREPSTLPDQQSRPETGAEGPVDNNIPERPVDKSTTPDQGTPTEPTNTPDKAGPKEAPPVEKPTPKDTQQPPEKTVQPDKSTPPPTACAPLKSTGTIINVKPSQAAQLPSIIANAKSGTTILLEKGTYIMKGNESQRRLIFRTPKITLKSASGDPASVIIDGEYKTNEIIYIVADDITIADLTIKRSVDHLIHVTGKPGETKRTRLHRLILIDGGEQFVKVNSDGKGNYVDNGTLECSKFELTNAGRPKIEPNPGGCYTGGIDAHGAWGWVVRRNTFRNIYCTNGGLSEHAIHFWTGSRDTLVEQNIIINCARGIGFGLNQSGKTRQYKDNPYPNATYRGHIDGIIRNNLIHTDTNVQKYYDTGIGLEQAIGAQVYHNTVISKPTFTSIDYRFSNTTALIHNNLTYRITLRNGAKGTVTHNLQQTPASRFVDVSKQNYRLRPSATQAINKGKVLKNGGLDLDGNPHTNGAPDLGAYEK